MNKKNHTILTALFLISAAALAFSQAPPPNGQKPKSVDEIFMELDVDKDDFISMNEAKGTLKDDFVKIDKNQDGMISRKVMEMAPPPPPPKGKKK